MFLELTNFSLPAYHLDLLKINSSVLLRRREIESESSYETFLCSEDTI